MRAHLRLAAALLALLPSFAFAFTGKVTPVKTGPTATLTPAVAVPLFNPALAPTINPLARPTLVPALAPTLSAPRVQAQAQAFVPAAPSAIGIAVAPQLLQENAVRAYAPTVEAGASIETAKTTLGSVEALQGRLSKVDAQHSSELRNFYERFGSVKGAAVYVDGGGSGEKAAPRQVTNSGNTGKVLLEELHKLTGKGYKSYEYGEAKSYMFSTVDHVIRNGVGGLIDAYSGIFVPGKSGNGGDYREPGDANHDGWTDKEGMNVEHIWPQSFFGKSLPYRSDIHHLMSTFVHPNGMRGHLPFGEVKGQADYSNDAGAKRGGGVFEPPNFSKGKVARAMMYFYTRYYDANIYQGSFETKNFWNDNIEMFMRWNRENPPTSEEMDRNDRIEKFQGNRNPFIDDYTLAEKIGPEGFRMEGRGGRTFTSSNSGEQKQGREWKEPLTRDENSRSNGRHGRDRRRSRRY